MKKNFYTTIKDIVEKDRRYKPDAYEFVMKSLFYAQKKLKKNSHLTGRELANGIKQYCFQEFGPMSKTVLEHWGIKKTSDFGHIVFNMVNSGLMKKTEEDSVEDFDNVYDFEEVFVAEYQEQLGRQLKKEQSKS